MNIERHYVTIGERQQHYRRCGSGPAVVLLHESPRSSVALLPLIEKLGQGFTIFALDTPGYGGSDALPHARPEIEDYADALRETFDALGISRAPVYGTHTGALIAFEFARRHRDRCAMAILDGFPVFTPNEREQFLASYLPPFRPEAQGAHLAWLWSRVRDQFRFFPWNYRGDDARLSIPFPPPEKLNLVALDFLATGDGYRVGYAAAFRHDTNAALSALDVPIVVATREDDLLFGHLERMPQLPEGSRILRLTANRDAWGDAFANLLQEHAKEAAPPVVPTRSCSVLPTRAFVRGKLLRMMSHGVGRPLVLLHHAPGGSSDFGDAMLRQAGKRPLYAIDLPGCGDSVALGSAARLSDYAVAVAEALDSLGLQNVDIGGDGIGAAVALAMGHHSPKRFATITLANVPTAGAAPPTSFTPEAYGEHLIRAWHIVRDDAIHGAWCARDPNIPHRFGSELDTDGIHRRVVDALKSTATLDLCRAALDAPLDGMRGNATVLSGMTPLAERIPT